MMFYTFRDSGERSSLQKTKKLVARIFGLLVKHYRVDCKKPEISQSVELFDSEKFNTNASVAEKLVIWYAGR